MSEQYPETGWDLLLDQSRPEVAIESAQQLAKRLRQTTQHVNGKRARAVYRPVEPTTYGDGFACSRQVMPYLPVQSESYAGVEYLGVVKIHTYWYGGGLLDPFAYEVYGTAEAVPLEEFWQLKIRNPELDLNELFADHKIATIGLTVAPSHSDQERVARYTAIDAAAQPLGVEAIDAVYNLVDLYDKQAATGLETSFGKLKKSLDAAPGLLELQPVPKPLDRPA